MIAALTFSPLLAGAWDDGTPYWVAAGLIKFFGLVLASGLSLVVIAGEVYLIHVLFSLPMRRAERARLFLDLLEGALQRGQPVEEMILSVAASRDQTVGVKFHVLAAYVEDGLRLGEALEKVPRFLPPSLLAMLGAGEKMGDLKKVLPAGREILRERPVAVRSAMHYLILVILFFSPVFVFVMGLTIVYVIPKFRDMAAGLGVQLWPVTRAVFDIQGWFLACELALTGLMIVAAIFYLGGPGMVRILHRRGFPIADWVAWRVPWKRKRLQRTFSAMLAVLLDGGVPETEAVRLAGDCTANEICRRRAARVVIALARGIRLEEAVRAFDDNQEFHWRLANAAQARGGFLNALRGWHEALDAKAFQQEEATAHVVTTGVVILNGAFVALIAIAMFGVLMTLLDNMAFSQ